MKLPERKYSIGRRDHPAGQPWKLASYNTAAEGKCSKKREGE
jgi:hypothetical protein